MKKTYLKRFFTFLLLTIIVCTSCRSVTIDGNKNTQEESSELQDNSENEVDSQAAKDEQTAFSKFTDRIFTEIMSESSLNVHSFFSYPENYGLDNCPYTFEDISQETYDENIEECKDYLDELNEFDYDLLTVKQKLTYDILKTDLEDTLLTSDFYLYDDFLSPLNGTPSSLPPLLGEFEFNQENDVIDYIEILKCVPEYYDNIMAYENEKADNGLGIPDFQIDAVIDSCKEFISDIDNHFLISTFDTRIEKVSDITDAKKADYIKKNSDLVKNTIIPAYEQLITSLGKLKGKSVNDGGLCNFKNGKEYYEQVIRYYTASDKSVSELKEIITDKMQSHVTTVVSLSLKDDSLYDKMDVYPFDTSDPDKILQQLIGAIADDFPEGYDTNYTVNDVPKAIEKYVSPAYFYIPHIDDSTKNNIYINRYKDYTDMDLYPTLAHEGFPGHMYQTTYFKNTNPDLIRSLLRYNGYIEGWGLYAELYSYDLSGQDSTVAKFNQAISLLSFDTYCLADIGINYEGWSREDTTDFIESIGYDKSLGDEMYETLIEDPGLYLAYYVGYLEFMDMRNTAEDELGAKFDIKAFHKFILDIGPSQFEIINNRFDIWLEQQKNKA